MVSKSSEKEKKVKKIKGVFAREKIVADVGNEVREYYDKSRFGEIHNGKVYYSLVEGLYLMEKGKMNIYSYKKKRLSLDEYMNKARKVEPNFWVRYIVFKDMRDRGYIVKTALKFGADFRVYERGVKPGEDHAKWILYPIHEGSVMTLYEFSAKNRVAHSTRKNLLLGIVDDESDVTYYTISWTRP